ncbi:T-cell surface glycoprotein CD8 beta chain-like isoform X2 [Heptranchias perlo]|uniref:T-cell surface glycoprotein CD8 beta chain-like isoform X2 n=1 Tax=Heptranchias perlo TaxID=212740 RepID=UPI00355A4CBC
MRRLLAFLVLQSYVQCKYLVIQSPLSQSVRLGDTVTLTCFIQRQSFNIYSNAYWLRQQQGRAPVILGYSFINSKQVFYSEEIPSNSSFKMTLDDQSLNLTIERVGASDAGHYFCAGWRYGMLTFGNGTKLILTGAGPSEDCRGAPSPASSIPCPVCSLPSSQSGYFIALAAVSLLLLLAAMIYAMQLKKGRALALTGDQVSQSEGATCRQNRPKREIHYASVNFSPTTNPKQRVECEMVYAEVRQDTL